MDFSNWLSDKESAYNTGDSGSISGLESSPGRGNGNPLQFSLPGKFHGQRSLADCSPQSHKELDMTEQLSTHTHTSLVRSVQSLCHDRFFVIPQTAMHQVSLSIIYSESFLKLMSIKSVMPSSHLILCHPLFLLSSIFPSFRVFSNESVLCIRWPKCWSFSFTISPSNDYLGLISFRIDWFDLLQSKRLSRVFSNTTVQKHQFFGIQLSF